MNVKEDAFLLEFIQLFENREHHARVHGNLVFGSSVLAVVCPEKKVFVEVVSS
jgi:hypothetical protein